MNNTDKPENRPLDERIDEVIESINGNGRFQWFALFIIAGATNATGFFVYCFAYLELFPQFICNYAG